MNKILAIGLLAFVFSSCQSESGKKENLITPTPNGVASASGEHSGQKPAVNPAHGQPFHDCALPVGAAFAAGESALPNAVTAPVEMQPNVRLNPAHGAPGHRCELPVGAPLG